LIIIDHTEVDDSLRGKGGGARLFDGMVACDVLA
jgi:predicted GNAT family acetyltransferase